MYLLGRFRIEFEERLLQGYGEIEEQNLFDCYYLSFFKSSVERLETSPLIKLTLLIITGSKIQNLDIKPLKCLEVLSASNSELETLKMNS